MTRQRSLHRDACRFCITDLTNKNRVALRQFEDDHNKHRLLSLPGKLFDEALAKDLGDERSAVKAQLALAIEILLMAPIRARNLIRLRFDESLIRPGGTKIPDPKRPIFSVTSWTKLDSIPRRMR